MDLFNLRYARGDPDAHGLVGPDAISPVSVVCLPLTEGPPSLNLSSFRPVAIPSWEHPPIRCIPSSFVFWSFLYNASVTSLEIVLGSNVLPPLVSNLQFGLSALGCCCRSLSWAVISAYRRQVAILWSNTQCSFGCYRFPFHLALISLSEKEYGINFCRACLLGYMPPQLTPVFRRIR